MEAVSEGPGILVFRYPSSIGRWSAFGRVVCYLAWIAVALLCARYMSLKYPGRVDRLATYSLATILILPALLCLWIKFRFFWTRIAVVVREADQTVSVVTRTPLKHQRSDYPLRDATAVHLFPFAEGTDRSWMVWIELLGDDGISLGYASREDEGRALARRAAGALGVPVRELSIDEFMARAS